MDATRSRNGFFLYGVCLIPPQENQTLCLTLHCSMRVLATESHIVYLFFFTHKVLLHYKKILKDAVRILLENGSIFKMKSGNKEQHNRYYVRQTFQVKMSYYIVEKF